jgi:hypothetical protein
MKVSGVEAVYTTTFPFIDQGGSTILIKPFILYLSLGLYSANLLYDLDWGSWIVGTEEEESVCTSCF